MAGPPPRSPFYRNLLRNPRPEGLNVSEPAPADAAEPPGAAAGWDVSIEEEEEAEADAEPGSRFRWRVKRQRVDLLAEGLDAALMDTWQPPIVVMDWYEASGLGATFYRLRCRLLGADSRQVLAHFQHQGPLDGAASRVGTWYHVAHVFERYGPGARYVAFGHAAREALTASGLARTRITDSSVSVRPPAPPHQDTA